MYIFQGVDYSDNVLFTSNVCDKYIISGGGGVYGRTTTHYWPCFTTNLSF